MWRALGSPSHDACISRDGRVASMPGVARQQLTTHGNRTDNTLEHKTRAGAAWAQVWYSPLRGRRWGRSVGRDAVTLLALHQPSRTARHPHFPAASHATGSFTTPTTANLNRKHHRPPSRPAPGKSVILFIAHHPSRFSSLTPALARPLVARNRRSEPPWRRPRSLARSRGRTSPPRRTVPAAPPRPALVTRSTFRRRLARRSSSAAAARQPTARRGGLQRDLVPTDGRPAAVGARRRDGRRAAAALAARRRSSPTRQCSSSAA